MKRQKYGYIYRTHLFGNPTVRVTGAENVKQILMGEHKLVSVQWPASVRTILGSDTLSNVHGALHKSKKKVRVFLWTCKNTSLHSLYTTCVVSLIQKCEDQIVTLVTLLFFLLRP